jgi:hypothetical protein
VRIFRANKTAVYGVLILIVMPDWGRFALLLQGLYYLLALWQESRRQLAGLAAPGSSTS